METTEEQPKETEQIHGQDTARRITSHGLLVINSDKLQGMVKAFQRVG